MIQDIRMASRSADTVRIVVDLSDKAEAVVFRLKSPERLVLDFKKTSFNQENKARTLPATGFIKGARTGVPNANTARIVIDLPPEQLTEKHFLLKPQGGNPYRFVIDLTRATGNMIPTTSTSSNVGLQPFRNKKAKVIMLDPGHGGQDPGAISKNGHYEKDLTLKMARELRDELKKEGYKVLLTRDSDIFIPLRGRIKKAHEANADLFISIHADSAKNKSARGLSVYTISEKASDAEAAALAERENKADIILGMDLGEYQPEVGNILIDFAKKHTMEQSAIYADHVVSEMKKRVTLVPNAHRFAGFVVLKSANIPSVLVELGYLSNKSEEKQLQKKAYRKKLAEALTRAIKIYFNETKE
jgi:N-acetylmuramoyl-L-alanine amidase